MASTLGNTSSMALGTLLSRITGVIRDIALVAAIGTGVFSDTYSVANSLPNIIYILIAGGAINAVFIPALVRHMKEDDDNGTKFTNRLLTLVGMILIAIVVISLIAVSLIIHLYATKEWSATDFHVAIIFALWCIPQIFFYGLFTLESQILNARDVFKLPMYAPIFNNIIVIGCAMAFMLVTNATPNTDTVSNSQLALLGFGTTLGVITQALILLPALRKSGYTYSPRFDFRNTGLGKLGDLALWTIGFVAVNQISFLIISRLTTYANVLASTSAEAATGFTSYQKAQLMMMLPHSIITVSIITALLPRLSHHAHEKDLNSFGNELGIALRNVIAFVVPCATILFFMGRRIGIILYGHGASSIESGAAVGFVASMFALGLPAFSVFYVLLRNYYAQENTKTPFIINLAFNALHMGIGITLFYTVAEHWKVASLAIAYSIGYTLVALFTWRKVASRLPKMESAKVVRGAVQVIVAALIAGFSAWIITHLVTSTQTVAQAIVGLLVFTLTFGVIFYGLAKLMKIDAINEVTNQVIRRLGKN